MISLDEILDTFDEAMKWTGTASRQEIHRLGIWHQTFGCWVLHRSRLGDFLLLQRRHKLKETQPNKLDISCAGHLSAGELPSDGIREMREELGIEVNFEHLRQVGVYRYSDVGNGLRDNEFCHIFILEVEDQPLVTYNPSRDEIRGLYLVSVSDLQSLCRQAVGCIPLTGIEIDNYGRKLKNTLTVTMTDMVNSNVSYYELLFSTIS